MSRSASHPTALITIEGTIKFESARAILFKPNAETEDTYAIDYGTEQEAKSGIWIPFSQISKIFKSTSEGMDHLVITEWIAKQKGIQT
jgi:hypothetical protein